MTERTHARTFLYIFVAVVLAVVFGGSIFVHYQYNLFRNVERVSAVEREVIEVKLPDEDTVYVMRNKGGDITGTVIEVVSIGDMPWVIGLKFGEVMVGLKFGEAPTYRIVNGYGANGKVRVGDRVNCISMYAQEWSGNNNVRFCAPVPILPPRR